MFIIHFPADPLKLINDFWTVGLINDGARAFIIYSLPMMASCFDNRVKYQMSDYSIFGHS